MVGNLFKISVKPKDMKKIKYSTNGRLDTEEDLDEAVAKIADPSKGKTKIKKKQLKKEIKEEY